MSTFRNKSDGKRSSVFGTKARVLGPILPGIVRTDAANVSQLDYNSDIQTQITSITTGVTSNNKKGMITTVSAATAAQSASTFTVTNSFATPTCNVQASIVDYSGTIVTNGLPSIICKNRTNGTFDIVILNNHTTNALAGTLVIGYEVLN